MQTLSGLARMQKEYEKVKMRWLRHGSRGMAS